MPSIHLAWNPNPVIVQWVALENTHFFHDRKLGHGNTYDFIINSCNENVCHLCMLQGNTSTGGITVNIGSLASLAPIGPIRLAPSCTSTSAQVTNTATVSEATSLTIHGTTESSPLATTAAAVTTAGGRGIAAPTAVLQLQGKQLLGGRAVARSGSGGTLTALSSLLQSGAGTRIVTSSAPSILLAPSTSADTHQIKGKVKRTPKKPAQARLKGKL